MGIGMMAMVVIMTMIVRVAVGMTVIMGMTMVVMAVAVIMIMVMIFVGADAFDVMVMALLRQTNLILEPKHLLAVLAHLAVHVAGAFLNLDHAVDECFQDQRLCVEIRGLDKLDVRVSGRDRIGVVVNPLYEDAGEQEIRENDNAPEPELCRMFQAGLDERKCDAGVADFAPAES